jgi:protein-disulfide isomerase
MQVIATDNPLDRQAERGACAVKILAAFAMALSCVSCDGRGVPAAGSLDDDAGTAQAAIDRRIVARAGTSQISLTDIEAPIQLQLHDLAMQRFRLVRRSLLASSLQMMEKAPDSPRVAHLALEPPRPPRLAVEPDPQRVRPAGEVPITLLAFCNFESPHCARLQITLAAVLPIYARFVRFAARDLPLSFHPHAAHAAEAARCALEQNHYWSFHDILYAGSGPLDAERLQHAARAALLDIDVYDACLESGRWAADVAADAARAAELGIVNVPAVFLNGLYVSPEVEAADLIWLIELELARLNVRSPRTEAPARPTTAPFTLRAALPSAYAGQGFAVLSSRGGDRGQVVAEGAALSDSLLVERIAEDGIWLRNHDVREWLSFGDLGGRTKEEEEPVSSRLSGDDDDDLPIVTPHRALPITLDRDEVLLRLADRAGLESTLSPVPMTSGGYRQLRINEVPTGSLYELLGLMPGDVILGVNEQPMHEADNPLWRALESEKEVRLRVMRRGGVANHYTYRIED